MSSQAEEFKKQGNTAFSGGKFQEAAELFTKAIELDSKNHILYSNRSACFTSLRKFPEALKDAETTIQLNPNWAKGYSRKGAALHGLGKLVDAIETYRTGLKLEPANVQMQQALAEVEKEQVEGETGMKAEDLFANLFSGDLLEKAKKSSTTSQYLSEPDFVEKVRDLQKNPKNLEKHIGDKRIAALLNVLLMSTQGQDPDTAMYEAQQRQEAEQRKEKERREEEAKKKKEEEEKKKQDARPQNQKESEAEKNLGNEAYKKRNFEVALAHYKKALEIDGANINVYLNKAAVYFEQGKLDECIAECETAIAEGRKVHADFQFYAKAQARIGNALLKQNKLSDALKMYNESQSNFRLPDVEQQIKKIEKQIEEDAKKAYIDPAKSHEAKERGNALVKDGKFPEAIKEYEEAIKRNPTDHTLYANRAVCYMKLQAPDQGIRDCDECLKLKPDFVKAYIRKGLMLVTKKEFHKAIQTFDEGLKHDANNAELKDGLSKCYTAMGMEEANMTQEERLKKASADPEIQEILSDPVMRQLLNDMTTDPKAARDHLKNPVVAEKIAKLQRAGIIGTR